MVVLITLLLTALYTFVVIKIVKSELKRSSVLWFFAVGIFLALIRAAFLWYMDYRLRTHTFTEGIWFLSYILCPEGPLMYMLDIHNTKLHMAMLTILLAVGSFVWALPLLLVNSKRKIKQIFKQS